MKFRIGKAIYSDGKIAKKRTGGLPSQVCPADGEGDGKRGWPGRGARGLGRHVMLFPNWAVRTAGLVLLLFFPFALCTVFKFVLWFIFWDAQIIIRLLKKSCKLWLSFCS